MSRTPIANQENRDHWIRRQLRDLPPGWRLLDAGAGQQRYRDACAHLQYVSQDFAQFDPKRDAPGLTTVQWDYDGIDIVCDIATIPEPDESFDAILCTEVLEHVPDPVVVLRELSRLLRPGGTFILTAPFCSLTHMAPHFHSTGFSRFYYEKHLSDLGFVVREVTPNGGYIDYLLQESGRLLSVAEQYSGRRPRWRDHLARFAFESMLRRFAGDDRGSADLLTFGYHVVAVKHG